MRGYNWMISLAWLGRVLASADLEWGEILAR